MSVFSDITNNIIATLNGMTFGYAPTRLATIERERLVNVIGDRFPFMKLRGPVVEVAGRAHRTAVCELYYLIEFVDDTIDDSFDSGVDVDEITKTTEGVTRDIWAKLMEDHTRGGYARNTEIDGVGHYFDDDGNTPVFTIDLRLTITTVVRDSDPNYTGG